MKLDRPVRCRTNTYMCIPQAWSSPRKRKLTTENDSGGCAHDTEKSRIGRRARIVTGTGHSVVSLEVSGEK